jgi:hypothetical protein
MWLLIVTAYYMFRCIFVIFPKFSSRSRFVKNMIIIQLVGMSLTLLGIIYSCFFDISIIKYLLYI